MSEAVLKTADRARRNRRTGLLVARAVGILLAVALAALLIGREFQAGGGFDLETLMGAARNTPWAPLVAVAVFLVLGQTGFPQFLMIAAAVMVFGPFWGFALSWTGTMISSSIGYGLGQLFGAELLRRFGGIRLNGLSEMLGRHGLLAIITLRNVPAGPFVVVNMVAGLSHITYRKFVLGTALGIIPKMAFIAFLGAGFTDFLKERSTLTAIVVLAVVTAWIGGMIWVRARVRRWHRSHVERDSDGETPTAA